MKVRIVSDGNAYSTKVVDEETGKDIEHVLDVQVSIDARHDFPRAYVTIASPPIDLIADAKMKHVCPYCGTQLDREGRPL